MKNKKIIIGIIIAIILIITIVAGVIIYISNQEKPEDVFNTYISYINQKNYEGITGNYKGRFCY